MMYLLVTGVPSLALLGRKETRRLCGEEIESYQVIHTSENLRGLGALVVMQRRYNSCNRLTVKRNLFL